MAVKIALLTLQVGSNKAYCCGLRATHIGEKFKLKVARETKPLSASVTLQTHLLLAVKPQKNKEGWDAHLSPSNGSQRESPGISSCWSPTQGAFVTSVNYGVMLLFWEIMHLKIPPAFDYLHIWGLCAEKSHTGMSVWRREKQSSGESVHALSGSHREREMWLCRA